MAKMEEEMNQQAQQAIDQEDKSFLNEEESSTNVDEKMDTENKEDSASTTTDELDTSTWKTYTNEEYGFSFKYPENVEVKTQGSDEVAVIDSNIDNKSGNTILTVMTQDPSIYEDKEVQSILTLNLKDFTQRFYQMTKEAGISEIKEIGTIKTSTIAGRPAYQFSVTYDCKMTDYAMCGEYLYSAIEDQKGMKYTVTIPSFQKVSNQILSTFQFTE